MSLFYISCSLSDVLASWLDLKQKINAFKYLSSIMGGYKGLFSMKSIV